jgi:hypothetical protein
MIDIPQWLHQFFNGEKVTFLVPFHTRLFPLLVRLFGAASAYEIFRKMGFSFTFQSPPTAHGSYFIFPERLAARWQGLTMISCGMDDGTCG